MIDLELYVGKKVLVELNFQINKKPSLIEGCIVSKIKSIDGWVYLFKVKNQSNNIHYSQDGRTVSNSDRIIDIVEL